MFLLSPSFLIKEQDDTITNRRLQPHIQRGEIIDALKELFAEQVAVQNAEQISDDFSNDIDVEQQVNGNTKLSEEEQNQLHSLSNDIVVS